MVEVLVTGGAGFIGSNFVRYALATHADWRVTTLDKLTYAGRRENLHDVMDNPRHTFVHGDIGDAPVSGPLVERAEIVVCPMRRRRRTLHAGRMITTTALTKRYNDVPVVRDVSLHCEPGTVTGFLGAENKPMPISEAEAMRIIHQVQEGVERPKASVSFEIGAATPFLLLALPRPSDDPGDRFKIKLEDLTRETTLFLLDESMPAQEVNFEGVLAPGVYAIEYQIELTVSSAETTEQFGLSLSVPAPASSVLLLLLAGGAHGTERLLGRKTIELVTRNDLDGDMAAMGQPRFAESNYHGIGFGLGFSVVLDPARAQILGSAGECAWGGMASTAFWIDPTEDLAVVMMTQLVPSSTYPIRRELRVLTYQAVVD